MTDELKFHLDKVLSYIKNAKESLPVDVFYFVSQLTPLINVDLLIKNNRNQVLLTWRDDRFHGPAWHIPGGIIRFKENIEDRVVKVAQLELGANVSFDPEPIHVRSLVNKDRDIRGHFISLLFICKLESEPDALKMYVSGTPQQGQWAWHDGAPQDLLKVHEVFRGYINDTPPL